jgi:hypothetical protein
MPLQVFVRVACPECFLMPESLVYTWDPAEL